MNDGYLDPKRLIRPGICGPGVEGNECFSNEILNKIHSYASAVSNRQLVDKVERVRESPNDDNGKALLYDPGTIAAMGDEEFVSTIIQRFKVFAPQGNKLFSNFNENLILKQLNAVVPSFQNFDCVLMDFHEDPANTLTSIATSVSMSGNRNNWFIEKICSGEILTFGTIPNTLVSKGDTTKVGHWVALFGDFRGEKWTIEYYNSTGSNAPKGMWEWMQRLANTISESCNRECIAINVSNVASQKGGTECGIYSLHYILCRLCGIDYRVFRKDVIKDNDVQKLRGLFMNMNELPREVAKVFRDSQLL